MYLPRLVGPVFVAALVSVMVFSYVTISIAHQQDDAALVTQTKILNEQLAKRHKEAALIAEDNAWWDQAVEYSIFQEDLQWMEVNWGQSVVGIARLSATFVLRPDLSLVYEKYHEDMPSASDFLASSSFRQAIQGMPVPEEFQPSSASGFTALNGDLFAYGASKVVAAGDEPLSQPFDPSTSKILIFIVKMDPNRLNEDAAEISASGLLYHAPGDPLPVNRPYLQLFDNAGNLAGSVCWEAATPGMDALKAMAVPTFIFLTCLGGLMYVFYVRAGKLVKQLEAADQAKSQFLASMSHEIRTPLNAVLGFSDMVSSEKFGKVEGDKNKEYLAIINKSGKHLLDIINDILDISKLDAGKYDAEFKNIQIGEVAEQTTHMIEGTAVARGVSIQQSFEPAALFSDDRIIRQILLNILSNAVKFEPENGTLLVSGKNTKNGYIITVEDHGPGMTPSQLKTALSLFGQVGEKFISKPASGTGLGLPLVQRFLKLIEGSMDINTRPGIGTIVTLSFPRGNSTS